MTIKPTCLEVVVVQGATLDEAWTRSFFPYDTEWQCGMLVRKDSGQPVDPADEVLEDYTGCTAEGDMRHPETGALIRKLSTADGTIVLDGAVLRLRVPYAETSAFQYGAIAPAWQHCTCQIEVTRPAPGNTRERQYSITFCLDPEGTT